MEFGVGLLGDLSSARIVDLSQRIEGYGDKPRRRATGRLSGDIVENRSDLNRTLKRE